MEPAAYDAWYDTLRGRWIGATGLDANPGWLAYARYHGGGARYRESDALSLPFGDASFDLVASVTALCFVSDWPGGPCAKSCASPSAAWCSDCSTRKAFSIRKRGGTVAAVPIAARIGTRQVVLAAMAGLPLADS